VGNILNPLTEDDSSENEKTILMNLKHEFSELPLSGDSPPFSPDFLIVGLFDREEIEYVILVNYVFETAKIVFRDGRTIYPLSVKREVIEDLQGLFEGRGMTQGTAIKR
tara:strand:- start:2446 stop:2772 length:327 start_codon:yes stop_codon:yes gene_type:complete